MGVVGILRHTVYIKCHITMCDCMWSIHNIIMCIYMHLSIATCIASGTFFSTM